MSTTPQPSATPTPKIAPVQGFSAGIPWEMHLRAYDAYCKRWSPQPALIEGWCRGGFHVDELDGLIPGWREELSSVKRLETELTAARAALTQTHERELELWAEVDRLKAEPDTWKRYYCELIEEIYGERPEGENERPDPCQVVKSMRAQLQAKEQELAEAQRKLIGQDEQLKALVKTDCGFGGYIDELVGKELDARQQLAARDATIADLTEALRIATRSADDQMMQKREAQATIAGLRGALKVARTFLDIDTPEGALTHIDGHLAQVPPTPLPSVVPKPDAQALPVGESWGVLHCFGCDPSFSCWGHGKGCRKPAQTAPKDQPLTLTSFCGLPADALEKHLKVCPPDCDPAVWQPDATQATGEAQPRRTDGGVT